MKKRDLFACCSIFVMSATVLTGCRMGQKSSDASKTQISMVHFDGTAKTAWVEEAAARFAESVKDVSFEEGKKGIEFHVTEMESVPNDSKILTSGYDILLSENRAKLYENAESGYLLNLNEVVQAIDPDGTRIDPDCYKRMVGPDGNYYGLPHYEWYSGVSYDIDLFTKKDLYFAAPDAEECEEACAAAQVFYDKDVESYKFVVDYAKYPQFTKRSTGPDGVYGTEDDGLPSSLQEFCILCEQIKSKGSDPFVFAGDASVYSFYLVDGLWASLAGKNKMNNVYCNWTTTPIDVVTGVSTTDELFYKGSGIYAPIIGEKNVVLDDSNGYKMYQMPERYYALSFLKLMINRGWMSEIDLRSGQSSFNAQNNFINGTLQPDGTKRQGAILYDASYWYHEAADKGYFQKYEDEHEGKKRNVAYMPLPTQIEGSITPTTEGNETKQTLMNLGSSYVYCRSSLSENEGRKNAVIQFLKFIYSDAELAKFTEKTGLTMPIKYTYDESKLSSYHAKLGQLKKDNDVVEFASSSMRFNRNIPTFSLYYESRLNNITIGDKDYNNKGFRYIMSTGGETAYAVFAAGFMTEAFWNQMSK